MRINIISLGFLLLTTTFSQAQTSTIKLTSKTFKTSSGIEISAQEGVLFVPENRGVPSSRTIKIPFVRLKSISAQPNEPLIYLEGGGASVTWQAKDPNALEDWLSMLKLSDLIFLDLRGSTGNKQRYIWFGKYPEKFFLTEKDASKHYREMSQRALAKFEKRGVDVSGYHIRAHGQDVMDLCDALDIENFSIFGFSFGSHIGLEMLNQDKGRIKSAIFAGADGVDMSFNYPAYLDQQVERIDRLIDKNEAIRQHIPNLPLLLDSIMIQLADEPIYVEVKHPIHKKKMTLPIGPFGLSLILRLDIDDAHDIPIIPRLLQEVKEGKPDLLAWFVQKRLPVAIDFPGNGIHQALASGASEKRWSLILEQASESPYGNVVNFPFHTIKESWPYPSLDLQPQKTDTRTLFISGSLDTRTPAEQTEEIMSNFSKATHLVVQDAGHEQAMWDGDIFDKAIPLFLMGKEVDHIQATWSPVIFIPLFGEAKGHPALD
ncbi:MAG: alpha/beta hydrolase [Bacteroidota bacterium]